MRTPVKHRSKTPVKNRSKTPVKHQSNTGAGQTPAHEMAALVKHPANSGQTAVKQMTGLSATERPNIFLIAANKRSNMVQWCNEWSN
jgi:hypothetical protein